MNETKRKELDILLVAMEIIDLCTNGGIVSLSSILSRELLITGSIILLLGDHDRLAVDSENDSPDEVNDHVKQGEDGVGQVIGCGV